MVKIYHCTDVYSAISIFNGAVFYADVMTGDYCLNLHAHTGSKCFSQQAARTGCFIHFEWISPSVGSGGGEDIKNCNFNELYTEWTGPYSLDEIWRLRIRAPYGGKDLLMKYIEYDACQTYQNIVNEYNSINPQGRLKKMLNQALKKDSPAIITAKRIIAELEQINLTLGLLNGRSIRIE